MFGRLLVEIREEGLQMSEKKEMTREEAISELQLCVDTWDKWMLPGSPSLDRYKEAVNMALSALRPITREQVEKMRGEWITKHYVDGILEGTNFDECSKCGYQRVFENPELKTKYMFCPGCGRAMWDEAVDMVMERMEALKDGKAD